MNILKKVYGLLRQQGIQAFLYLIRTKLNNRMSNHEKYRHWIAQYEKGAVRGEDGSTWMTDLEVGDGMAARLRACRTPWVLLHQKEIAVSSRLTHVVDGYLRRHPQVQLVYTDGDIRVNGVRKKPIFKADWSPDTYLCHDYIGGMMLVRTELARNTAEQMSGRYEPGWMYDFGLRATEKLHVQEIAHVDQVLYHRQEKSALIREEYLVEMKEQAIVRRQKKQKEAGICRTHAKAELRKGGSVAAVVYQPCEQADGKKPLVSIIMPSKDNPQLLRTCVESVEKYTTYDQVEWIIVDNGSSEEHQAEYRKIMAAAKFPWEYVYDKKEFNFSYMCNTGAKYASGELLLFLNDDMELPAQSGDWLERLVGQALQPHTGAVGAKLLYPDTTMIQHIGVVNYTTGAAHLLWQKEDSKPQPFWRNEVEHNYAVVTGACICIEKEKFWSVGGFEERLAVTFNDVALCLALLRAGYYQVVRTDVILYHHESITRGNDHLDQEKIVRNLKERELLYDLFPEYVGVDPFYSRHLTQTRLDHTLDYPHRPKLSSLSEVSKSKGGLGELSANVHYRMERITIEEDIVIEGWAYFESKRVRTCRRLLLEGENGELYEVPVQKVYTPTLNQLTGSKQNLYFAGFVSRFACAELEENVGYRVYLDFGNGSYDTGVVCKPHYSAV